MFLHVFTSIFSVIYCWKQHILSHVLLHACASSIRDSPKSPSTTRGSPESRFPRPNEADCSEFEAQTLLVALFLRIHALFALSKPWTPMSDLMRGQISRNPRLTAISRLGKRTSSLAGAQPAFKLSQNRWEKAHKSLKLR